MDVRKTFSTNKSKEEEGVWVKGPDGAQFRIARSNNAAAEKLAAELRRPHRRAILAGTLAPEIQKDIAYTVLAQAILLDWRGVTEGGQEVAFSPATAKRFFIEMEDFADFIAGYASEVALFRDEENEARRGNSSSASSGTSSGAPTPTSPAEPSSAPTDR